MKASRRRGIRTAMGTRIYPSCSQGCRNRRTPQGSRSDRKTRDERATRNMVNAPASHCRPGLLMRGVGTAAKPVPDPPATGHSCGSVAPC
jgi:hypothetical protein